ncbi:MAG: ABC transporter permease [Saprospiraceae bacterium]|nr:ABC transporter permease [Saprospiraceae bacterium]MBK6784241.1 ABC transporter permease [Saprospiraceae bacterium]MBK7525347.1 ABC transporter permease [Saprospiraceae bacterium]MBK8372282.1 ABC transporter permease [Saprospiraceae bacterium]MBK8547582.1 ABC transporter permease [Saprospiraceae bacterium]
MDFLENLQLAIGSIKANFLRSFLTLLIIAVGIACLVGILTAIDSILFSMSDNFNRLGANSFYIRPKSETIRSIGQRTEKISDPIDFDQAFEFKEFFQQKGYTVSSETKCADNVTVRYESKKTNPNTRVQGIDENYIITTAFEVEYGRNFTPSEVYSNSFKVIIGSEIAEKLFGKSPDKAIQKTVYLNANKYVVVGVLKEKGNSSGGSNDRAVFIPLYNAKTLYGYADKNYNLSVSVAQANRIDDAIDEAIGVLRNVRRLKIGVENDFEIKKSDGILKQLKEMTTNLRLGTLIIASLTLLGASIGLMNIMLVSVTERTKEIGIRKAIGASRKVILRQFLMEALMICLLGGVVGIILGMGFGAIVTIIVKGRFFIPWNWMLLAIIVCIVVGLASGLYPALKASKLDPIDALRYE